MSDADASPPTAARPAEPDSADAPAPGLVRPVITPLVTLGSEDADACSDGVCS